jgi:hypothetical protein
VQEGWSNFIHYFLKYLFAINMPLLEMAAIIHLFVMPIGTRSLIIPFAK